MKVVKQSPIDWEEALDALSVGAFYLLNILARKDVQVSDKQLIVQTGYGLSTHRKQKRELLNCEYLVLKQVDKGVYLYTIGTKVTNG